MGRFLDRLAWVEYFFRANTRTCSFISQTTGSLTGSKNLFVLFIFGEVDNSRLQLIENAKNQGFDTIVVSNESDFPQEKSVSDLFIRRVNRGRDIGALGDLMAYLANEQIQCENLIWMNDSFEIHGAAWNDLFTHISQGTSQGMSGDFVLGITDSFQRKYHLQSYFYYIHGSPASMHDLFRSIAQSLKSYTWKRTLVNHGEILLTTRFQENGFSTRCHLPYSFLASKTLSTTENESLRGLIRKNVPLNPTIHFWDQVSKSQFSLIKKLLVKDNPAKIKDVSSASKLLSSWRGE